VLRVCGCVCLSQPPLGFTPPELVGGCSAGSEVVLSGAADCFSLAALTYLLVAGTRAVGGRGGPPNKATIGGGGVETKGAKFSGWGRPPRGTCGGKSCTSAFLAVASAGFGSTAVGMRMHVLPPHAEKTLRGVECACAPCIVRSAVSCCLLQCVAGEFYEAHICAAVCVAGKELLPVGSSTGEYRSRLRLLLGSQLQGVPHTLQVLALSFRFRPVQIA
jgi:hypothetical protein